MSTRIDQSEFETNLESVGCRVLETSPDCFRWVYDDGSEAGVWSSELWVAQDTPEFSTSAVIYTNDAKLAALTSAKQRWLS